MPDKPNLLANHGLALLQLARQPDSRISDLAAALGVTERAAQNIVSDLARSGYVERIRSGRRNRYLVRADHPLGQRGVAGHSAAEFINAFIGEEVSSPHDAGCQALVVACTDFRVQGWLRSLLADQRLLDRAELLLCPGGGATLAGPGAETIYPTIEELVRTRSPRRLLLVAHRPCDVPGLREAGGDVVTAVAQIRRRQRRVIRECRRRVGLEPEVWLVDPGRFSGLRVDLPAHVGTARALSSAG